VAAALSIKRLYRSIRSLDGSSIHPIIDHDLSFHAGPSRDFTPVGRQPQQ
jgi:hypothetical protein